jgi:hypothetical protein
MGGITAYGTHGLEVQLYSFFAYAVAKDHSAVALALAITRAQFVFFRAVVHRICKGSRKRRNQGHAGLE